MSNPTATKLMDLQCKNDGHTQALYRCEGGDLPEYVVASAVTVIAGGRDYGPETYLFPADKDGNITSYGELTGSQRGTLDHAAALRDAGYEVRL